MNLIFFSDVQEEEEEEEEKKKKAMPSFYCCLNPYDLNYIVLMKRYEKRLPTPLLS